MQKKAYLTLENGRVFEGRRFGAPLDAQGEMVFTTGMVGYLETLTDPSHAGQIVVQTFPLIGNYGVIPADFESAAPSLAAYVVREWCDAPSNFRSEGELDSFLRARGVPGLCGVDTRALTRVLRGEGTMRARLADTPGAEFAADAPIRAQEREGITTRAPESPRMRVALIDYGVKESVIAALLERGCAVTLYPAATPAEAVLADAPDGILLSDGPGDPAADAARIAQAGVLLRSGLPVLGICLGHQLLALARGAKVHRLKFGHHGANQAVLHAPTGRIYATAQNHGYVVDTQGLPAGLDAEFINVNDGTCEGIAYADTLARSVQFAPDGGASVQGTGFVYDRFVARMEGRQCR